MVSETNTNGSSVKMANFLSTEALMSLQSNHASSTMVVGEHCPIDSLLQNWKGPPQGWGVLPWRFNYKQSLIHILNLTAKFHWISSPKNLSNRLRHTSRSWTSLWMSWTFLDSLILKLPELLIYIRVFLTIMIPLLEKLMLGSRCLEYYIITPLRTFVLEWQ